MSSFLKKLINPKTGKEQVAYCWDDYFGHHQYGYIFRMDGEDALLGDRFNCGLGFDVFTEYQINCKQIVNQSIDDCKQKWEEEYNKRFRCINSDCDNNGTRPCYNGEDWEPEQCQFCFEFSFPIKQFIRL